MSFLIGFIVGVIYYLHDNGWIQVNMSFLIGFIAGVTLTLIVVIEMLRRGIKENKKERR